MRRSIRPWAGVFLFMALFLWGLWKGVLLLSVTSGSMSPKIPVGSMVFVLPCSFEKLQEGDVVTFSAPEGGPLVTHRVLIKNTGDKSLITKGDANAQADAGRVPFSRVKGRVAFHLPFLGYVLFHLSTARGKIGVGILLFLLGLTLFTGGAREERRLSHG